MTDWTAHARETLAEAGYRSSAPRHTVIEALAREGCSVTAREVAEALQRSGSSVGIASVYRTLDLLDRLGLVQRFDVGEGVARYEPAHPDGHHHHIVCESCGNVVPFEDDALERAIDRLAGRVEYAINAHEVTLRGECPACAEPAHAP